MTKNRIKHLLALALFTSIGACALFFTQNTFAWDPSGGSSETSGGEACKGGYVQIDKRGYHNCCAGGNSCPHYIYIPNTGGGINQAFVNAVNAGEDAAGFMDGGNNGEGYNKCKTDPNGVVIVGTDYGTLRATNWHSQNSHHDYKTYGSNWWWNDHVHVNMGDKFPGTNKTYGEYKNAYLTNSGTTEYNLAFFCPSLVEEPETTFVSNSYVKVTIKLPSDANQYVKSALGGESGTKQFQVYQAGGGSNWTPRGEEKVFNLIKEMLGGYTPPVGTEVTVNFLHKLDVGGDTDAKPSANAPRKTEWKTTYAANSNTQNAEDYWYHAHNKESGTATFTDTSAQTVSEYVSGGEAHFVMNKKKALYKVCEKIQYGMKTKETKKATIADSGKSSRACVTISVDAELPVDKDCNKLANNAVWSSNLGRSDAQSWVRKSYQEDWSHLIYARPGEQITFAHCYYAYAHSATASLSWDGKDQAKSPGSEDHGEHIPAYYVQRTCYTYDGDGNVTGSYECGYWAREKTSNAPNNRISRDNVNDYCLLQAGVSWGGGNYLFDRGEEDRDNSICNGDQGEIHTTKRSATMDIFYSPFPTSTNYSCDALVDGFYQIVGYDPRSQCRRGGSTMSVSSGTDVGRTFYQYIVYGGTILTQSSNHMDYDHGLAAHYSDFRRVDTRQEGRATGTSANVVVPYNFNTTAKVSGNSSPIVYPGEPVSFSSSVEITPRFNPDVTTSTAYATITPPSSKIVVVQFTLDPSVPQPGNLKGGISSSGAESSVAQYIQGKTGADFRSYVTETVASGAFNKGDNQNGLTGTNALTYSSRYTVPDDEAGVKYCYAVAVYPADSHNKSIGEDLPAGANNDGAGQEGRTAWRWRVSDIRCSTIVKKPNVQIWGSGLYSNGDITASTSTKCLNWTLSTNSGCGDSRRRFGSWSESEIIANGVIIDFASANGYGYDRYFHRSDYYNTGTLGYGVPGGNTSTLFMDVAKQTISNNQTSSRGGYANIDISTDVLDRILNRYSSSRPEGFQGGAYDGNNATSTAGPIYLGRDGGVVVIYSTRDFTINHNITIEENGYTSVSQIPQVLIIAPNISISSNVTNVDAWLITTNRISGTLNTCKEFVSYQTQSTGPCNQMLTVNGPVFAMRVLFNRSAGAGIGNQSINPAERFNLSAANYLWAYAQAEQLQQAFTTYTRELAPRF